MRGRDGAFWHRCACGWAGYRKYSDAPCPRCKGKAEVSGGQPGAQLLPHPRVRKHVNVYVPNEVLDALHREQIRTRTRTLSRTVASILEVWFADQSMRRESAE